MCFYNKLVLTSTRNRLQEKYRLILSRFHKLDLPSHKDKACGMHSCMVHPPDSPKFCIHMFSPSSFLLCPCSECREGKALDHNHSNLHETLVLFFLLLCVHPTLAHCFWSVNPKCGEFFSEATYDMSIPNIFCIF